MQRAGEDYPESFFCPITTALMSDPVVDREGNSYGSVCLRCSSPIVMPLSVPLLLCQLPLCLPLSLVVH